MKFSLIVLGLLVVGYAHWSWPGRLAAQAHEDSPPAGRYRMVEDQIKARGIKDERVLAAMLKVPRERFVPSGVAPEIVSTVAKMVSARSSPKLRRTPICGSETEMRSDSEYCIKEVSHVHGPGEASGSETLAGEVTACARGAVPKSVAAAAMAR